MTTSELSAFLSELEQLPKSCDWPEKQLALCHKYNLYEWFSRKKIDSPSDQLEAINVYFKISEYCQITSFLLLQSLAAFGRIYELSDNPIKDEVINALKKDKGYLAVAVSHILTSHQYLTKPTLSVKESNNYYLLDGFAPWVSGAKYAEFCVTGAFNNNNEILIFILPMHDLALKIDQPPTLMAFNETYTANIHFEQLMLEKKWLMLKLDKKQLPNIRRKGWIVMNSSLRALALCHNMIDFFTKEAQNRESIQTALTTFSEVYQQYKASIFNDPTATNYSLKLRAQINQMTNDLAQAVLIITKGQGYTQKHPAQIWCRQALFYRVHMSDESFIEAQLTQLVNKYSS